MIFTFEAIQNNNRLIISSADEAETCLTVRTMFKTRSKKIAIISLSELAFNTFPCFHM